MPNWIKVVVAASLSLGLAGNALAESTQIQDLIGKAVVAHSKHKFSDATEFYKQALELAEQQGNQGQAALACKGLGMLFVNQGQYAEAVKSYQRAVDIESSLPNVNPKLQNMTLTSLGAALGGCGRYREAESVLVKALGGAEKLDDKENQVSALQHLSFVYTQAGQQNKAEPLINRALNLAEGLWGAESTHTAQLLSTKGQALGSQGRYKEAEAVFKQAMNIDRRLLGGDSLPFAKIGANLANLYLVEGKLTEAKDLYQNCIEIRKAALGSNDRGLASLEAYLSRVYLESGDVQKALTIGEDSLALAESGYGANNKNSFYSLISLGTACLAKGDTSRALEYAKRALAIDRTFRSLLLMAQVMNARAELVEAEKYAREAVAEAEKTFGTSHPQLGKCLDELAKVLKSEHKFAEAKSVEERSRAIRAQFSRLNQEK